MDKEPLIIFSICAVVLLLLCSLNSVFGYQTMKSFGGNDSLFSNEGNEIIFHGVVSIKAESADCEIPDQCHKGRLYLPFFPIQINIPFGTIEIRINGKMHELQEYPTMIMLRGFLGFGPNETHGLSNVTFFGVCREILVLPYSLFSDYIDKQPLFNVNDMYRFGQTAWGLAAADFNKDGNTDYAVSWSTVPWSSSTISIFYNHGAGNYTKKDVYTITSPWARYIEDLNAADYDKDGDIDLLFTYSEYIWYQGMAVKVNGVVDLLKNDGNDTFNNVSQIIKYQPGQPYDPDNRINPQLCSADYNMDGNIDFLEGDNSGNVEFYTNDGTGNFTSAGIINKWGDCSWGLTSGDFNNDGDLDFLVISEIDPNAVWGYIYLVENQMTESNHTLCFPPGPGEIILQHSWISGSLQSLDYNNDGQLDFITSLANSVYLCMKNQTSYDVFSLGGLPPINGYGDDLSLGAITASDMNNDGKIDILTGGDQGIVRFWTNMYGPLPPFRPTIQQPSVFQAHKNIQFNITSKDINYNNISYFVDWGDGTNSGWVGPFPPGWIINLTHVWKRARSYVVSFKAKNINGESQIKEYVLILFPGLPSKIDFSAELINPFYRFNSYPIKEKNNLYGKFRIIV